jgi:hypothetical protein
VLELAASLSSANRKLEALEASLEARCGSQCRTVALGFAAQRCLLCSQAENAELVRAHGYANEQLQFVCAEANVCNGY